GPTAHVRLSGIFRPMTYTDVTKSSTRTVPGWGVLLSSVAHPHRQLTTYASANCGRGVAGLGGDLAIGNYDLVADPERPGRLYAPLTVGWCAGLQWNFRPNIFVSASVSGMHYLPRHPVSPTEYRNGITADINAFWNLTPRIQFGAELDYARRANQNGQSGHSWRAGMLCQFSF
ncbi:MAG: hypothetical protein K2M97_03195, partial [Muribaculaceae bacterium]|nr:hypothetical protein [Muribaculaceae bacterium]